MLNLGGALRTGPRTKSLGNFSGQQAPVTSWGPTKGHKAPAGLPMFACKPKVICLVLSKDGHRETPSRQQG